MFKRHTVITIIAGLSYILSACSQSTEPVIPTTAPNAEADNVFLVPAPEAIGAALNFTNVTPGQVFNGLVTRAPGVSISGGTIQSFHIELLRSDGSLDWERTESENLICITGATNGLCNTWDTTKRDDGNKSIRATATLTNGKTLTAKINFAVDNGSNRYIKLAGLSNIVSGVLDPTPYLEVKGYDVSRVVFQIYRSNGPLWWEFYESTAPYCFNGHLASDQARCNNWETTKIPDGAYTIKAVAKMDDGSTQTTQRTFNVTNQTGTRPPPTPPAPPPTGNPSLTYINIAEGQILSGYPQAPGVTLQNATAKSIKMEFAKSDGTNGWINTSSKTPTCVIDTCTTWDTTKLPNGDYYMRPTLTLLNGEQLTGLIHFKIANGNSKPPPPPTPPSPPSTKSAWNNVKSWGIQYHKFNVDDLKPIANSGIDVVVIGSKDGYGREWTSANIATVTKKVWLFQYISAGQAEAHEWYFNPGWRVGNPSWILSEWYSNAGVYNVAYWDSNWQNVIKQGVDRAMNKGFNGVFLDQTDPYWNTTFPKDGTATQFAQFRQRSRDLVCNVASYARAKNSNFKIFVNGGANQYDSFGSSYSDCLDAIAGEHLWYLKTGTPDRSGYPPFTIPIWQRLLNTGKKVFTFDYTSSQYEINRVLSESRNRGFIPTITDTSISTTPKYY